MDGHCSLDYARCWLWHDNALVPAYLEETLHITHGNYVRLAVPAHPDRSICDTGEELHPDEADPCEFPVNSTYSQEEEHQTDERLQDHTNLFHSGSVVLRVQPHVQQGRVRSHVRIDSQLLEEHELWPITPGTNLEIFLARAGIAQDHRWLLQTIADCTSSTHH